MNAVLLAVLRAALVANGPEAGPMALFFAGTRPERTSALILADATARYLVADDYPIGVQSETAEAMIGRAEELWAPRPTHPPAGAAPDCHWATRCSRPTTWSCRLL
jgi:hypothetical protein